MIITLTDKEVERCKDFSGKSAMSQQAVEFGQSSTAERSVKEIARDNLIGKLAEFAVVKYLFTDFGISIGVDMGVYPRGVWDDNDITINGWDIDIKSTRKGQWFLIEWHKLEFRQRHGDLPHAFLMCKTLWDMEMDEPLGDVDLIGGISTERLMAGAKNVLTLKKGDFIPNTQTKLQADNYAVHFGNLENDLDMIISYMLTNPPPDMKRLGMKWSVINGVY